MRNSWIILLFATTSLGLISCSTTGDVPEVDLKKKTVPPTTFLYARQTLSQSVSSADRVGQIIPALKKEAAKNKMKVVGPIHLIYPANNSKLIDIALPVQPRSKRYRGSYHIRKSPAFTCYVAVHRGSLDTIDQTWHAVLKQIRANDWDQTGEEREVFVKWVSYGSPQNVTELQMGTQ